MSGSGARRAGTTLGGALAVAAAGLAYAYVETKLFTVRHVTVPVLPAGQGDVRVLHVSDLHLVPRQRRKLAWIRSLAELRPDLVVDTGDNLADVGAVDPLLDALDPLLATAPGVFVMGSNDYWAPRPKNPARYLLPDARVHRPEPVPLPWDRMAAAFTAAGWKDLDNRRDDVVLADGRRLSFVGTDDAHLDLDAIPERPAGAPAAGATHDDAVLHLGVTHAPYQRVLNGFQSDGADLIIAGHTHGGQLRVPGFGALVTNCDLDRRRASGLHGWPGARPDRRNGAGSTWLHVSAGAGTSPYAPVRFACRPEATLLTLTAR
ncbi:metallophosphoesterase [Xylanimonas protaetiae]|uniref:Metallophosphoesterase n=1 Tax=Xylanimonas protaetiae TaxID=2509457 RepID=A0A4P6F6T6_9MICO|nr:metallophosphoesterase [Xylanimonas protaetiae]QAY71720.1 metallophosphoesterase [Xylanimonas protaetiae]